MRNFLHNDTGAVTLDWVALSAGIVALAVLFVAVFTEEVQSVMDAMKTEIGSATNVARIS